MVYNYTKPRGPIAAHYSSPGPCYKLPGLTGQNLHDPRSYHRKQPAYPFGVRHGKYSDDCSPGPCYALNPKVTKYGADGTPHYSLYSRNKDLASQKNPGPGTYSPEHAGQTTYYRAPTFAFGTRHRSRRNDNNPAPNSYSLPPGMGTTIYKHQAPQHSLTGRNNTGSFHEDLQKTPGPGTYDTTAPSIYRQKMPEYSMTSRNVMPGDTTQKPGPGAHSPERVYVHKRQAPEFSFGIRHSQYTAPLIVDCQD
ncbi:hypothetical protein KUTeg_007586 [Tegillarca granosa]|uniref:Outer dense fiber protein 3 n=1 Tax=Tegillarca granosa TaxID=220873 RepID=A0ABQ9FFN1_TEGGR|nr:hypothetical protein KUTeg_007586 [Tegillarca granosa]